jgi:hypothetical protein
VHGSLFACCADRSGGHDGRDTCSVTAQPPLGQAQVAKKQKAPVGLGVLSARKKAKSGKLPKGASNLIGKWQAVQQVRHG